MFLGDGRLAARLLMQGHRTAPMRGAGSKEAEPKKRNITMEGTATLANTDRYTQILNASKKARWDLEKDVIRGRQFDLMQKYLPDGLSLIPALEPLTEAEKIYLSQIQGRTYANIFGLVERFIGAKALELTKDYWLGDQKALEALVRFTDEELKHQELFRRIESMIAEKMPAGYRFTAEPDAVATAVLSKSTWAVLALTAHIELFTQSHYKQSIDADPNLSPLFKDVFRYHWMEESQHAVIDELEWIRENSRIGREERDAAVNDLIALVAAVDGILVLQSDADAQYFFETCGRALSPQEQEQVRVGLLKAYRWQYIVTGVQHPKFTELLGSMITPEQGQRIHAALAPIVA
jgi:hypothetical protein